MIEKLKIRLVEAENTIFCGSSLARSLYTLPVTLFLGGELGAGKTTFLQGFARELGIKERLTSPTYALEQRYKIPRPPPSSSPPSGGSVHELLHVDLYRIDPKEAKELVHSTDDFEGIRCIEWSERIAEKEKRGPHIDLMLQDNPHSAALNNERTLSIQFHDILLPTRSQIKKWRKNVKLLTPICRHCDTVGVFAEKIAHQLIRRGIIVRPLAVRRAGELHDLLRFLNFKNPPPNPPPVWGQWTTRYPNIKHEHACALFLREQGFDALATIIEPHGLMLPSPNRYTIEQKVLFYADKRTIVDRVVSIEERFEDFKQRYGAGRVTKKHTQWYEEVKLVEKELFPDGLPLP